MASRTDFGHRHCGPINGLLRWLRRRSGGSAGSWPRRSLDPGDGHVHGELPFSPLLDREGRAAMQAAKAKLLAGILTQAEFDRIQSVNAYIAQLADDTAFS